MSNNDNDRRSPETRAVGRIAAARAARGTVDHNGQLVAVHSDQPEA